MSLHGKGGAPKPPVEAPTSADQPKSAGDPADCIARMKLAMSENTRRDSARTTQFSASGSAHSARITDHPAKQSWTTKHA